VYCPDETPQSDVRSLGRCDTKNDRVATMMFAVQFTRRIAGHPEPCIIRTANFETDDLHSVVSRTRIILSTRGYEPRVDAFQIIANDAQVVYHEERD
jgi:hypothetical protein